MILTGCKPSSLGIAVDYSCSDDGVAQTQALAKEIIGAVGPESKSALGSHGCDSTPSGYYNFDFTAKQAIIDRFDCQTADLVVFTDTADEWLCWAQSGRFTLYSSFDVSVVAVEVLP